MKQKIAFILRTTSLEHDDRVRKEALSLSNKYEVFIFVNYFDNHKEEGITSYNIRYKAINLKSRELLPSSKFLFFKLLEFYFSLKKELKEFDIIWLHEEFTFLFPLFMKKKFIWDLHELPTRFNNKIMKYLFLYLEKKVNVVIHANKYRIEYLKQIGLINDCSKHKYINNYPDKIFLESDYEDLKYKKFLVWLGKKDYVYLQGLSTKSRYPINSLESVLISTKLKVVIIGTFEKTTLEYFTNKYSDFFERVFLTNTINQLATKKFIEKAKFSIILYDHINPNNRYCEPNRFYQAISLSVPVIVSSNEPMEEVVNKYKLGVVLENKLNDLKELIKCINFFLANYSLYKMNVKKHSNKFLWSDNNVFRISSL